MICKANYCTGSHQILPASMTGGCWIGTAWCLLQEKYVFIHTVDKLSVASITNKTFQLNKIGPDDMQSHPLHFGQYQALPAMLRFLGDGDCYLMHRMQIITIITQI